MDFEWDEAKRASNLEKHGLDFAAVTALFSAPHFRQRSGHDGEPRFIAVGELDGRVVTVVYTLRETRIRLISARRARASETRTYRAHVP